MRRTIEADENTKETRATGTRGGSRRQRGKQGHSQAKAQALDDTGGAKKRAADKRKGRPQKAPNASAKTSGARRGTGRRAQRLNQRGETAAYRRATSGKKKTRARSAGRQGAT